MRYWYIETVDENGKHAVEKVKIDLRPVVENGDLLFTWSTPGVPTFPECGFARGTWRRFYSVQVSDQGGKG